MADSKHLRVPQPVYQTASDVKDEYDYPSIGEAVRHVFREADYDV
jgi:hypothetical protein